MGKIQKTNPTAKMFKLFVESGEVNFDLPRQRGDVWSIEKRSKLIESIFLDYPIPPIYANFKDGIYHIVDGKQRGKTISGFQQNKFSLAPLPPFVLNGHEYNISGEKFISLPSELSLIIEQFNMDLHYKENMTDKEQDEMFIRLNYGKPLSATEMTRAQIKSIFEVKKLAQHSVFKKILNAKGFESSKNDDFVMQIYAVLFEDKIDLLAVQIRKVLAQKRITIEEQNVVSKCLDNFEDIYSELNSDKSDEAKRAVVFLNKKTHLVSFVCLINRCIESKVYDLQLLAGWVKYFFNGRVDQTSISEEYNSFLLGGINRRKSVNARIESMYQSFLNYRSMK